LNATVDPVAVSAAPPPGAPLPRIRVFVDYWNLVLTLGERESAETHQPDARFNLDWKVLPAWLAKEAAAAATIKTYVFEGVNIHASYDKNTQEGRKFNSWATGWLNRQPGVQVQCHVRRPKNKPKCSVCHHTINNCPRSECGEVLAGTIEKGVDTSIATDMIRLAWEDAYDVGVLASLDADLVPAVHFLDQKGKKIIQAGFPPKGVDLATACWASFDIFSKREEIRRP
jgi:uncharacterized LabA/DUF88 family protein